MIVRPGLLRILWRQALPATLLGSAGLGAYALLWPDVITGHDFWPWLLVLVHILRLPELLGRFRSPAFAFLYSRGYSRDALWGHLMLASVLSIVMGWLPAALIVWTGLRSFVHDRLFQSPYFPVMTPCENLAPLVWLGLYLLLTPAFHYAWIRSAQSTKGAYGGRHVAVALLLALLTAFTMVYYLHGWFAWFSGVSYAVALVCLVLGGRALNRTLEVRT